MTLFGALRSGVSGLFTQGQALGTISDNIANVNTVGYKTKRIRFSTVVSQNGNSEVFSPGGVTQIARNEISAQGLIQGGQSPTDLAIQGNGFFAVTNSLSHNRTSGRYEINGATFYTRAGEFRTDGNGNLRNSQGNYLVGYPPDPNNAGSFVQSNIVSDFVGINAGAQTSPPVPTSEVRVSGNLNTNVAAGGTATVTIPLFDRLGIQRNVEITYTRTTEVNDIWDATARVLPETVNRQPNNDTLRPNLRIGALSLPAKATRDVSVTTVGGNTLNNPIEFEITLAFDEELNEASIPPTGAFGFANITGGPAGNTALPAAGGATATTFDSVEVSGRLVTIKGEIKDLRDYNLMSGINAQGQNIQLTYQPTGSVPKLQDLNGNEIADATAASPFDVTLNEYEGSRVRAAAGTFNLGRIEFQNGLLRNITPADGLVQPTGTQHIETTLSFFNGSGDAENVPLSFDFGTQGQSDGLSQFGASGDTASSTDNFTINSITQNGRTFGTLVSVQVSENGTVTAAFDNGENRDLAQVPVVTFNSPNDLEELTGNIYRPTPTSGSAIPHIAGSGGAGRVQSNSVEASTVDIAFEFTELITTQRAYAANTRIITTADNLLQELLTTVR